MKKNTVPSFLIISVLLLTSMSQVLAVKSSPAQAPVLTPLPAVQAWVNAENDVPLPASHGCFTMAYPNSSWQQISCGSLPPGGLPPMTIGGPLTVGGSSGDERDTGTNVISAVTGSFTSEKGYQAEQDSALDCFPFPGYDWYSLQLNTNYFTSVAPYSWWDSWVQFGLQNEGCISYNTSYLSASEWLIGYVPSHQSCPSGFTLTSGSNCLSRSYTTLPHYFDPAYLTKYTLKRSVSASYLTARVCDNNVPQCWANNYQYDYLGLASYWKQTEFNILGFGTGSQAVFSMGSGDSIGLMMTDSGGSRSCGPLVNWTAETNNLNLGTCSGGTSYIAYS